MEIKNNNGIEPGTSEMATPRNPRASHSTMKGVINGKTAYTLILISVHTDIS